ncbi:class I SAM-dependent methyltransferase [Paraburkholderia bengalensis]|uniref:Class I SAM-dependent methyltransferase n=1 Tax=Paraburkholderia bengalensis TaxID=2747562 RepID=A0ABU8J4I7_9BURK
MSFSAAWEDAFRQGGHDSRWPWSDLVSMTKRHARTLDETSRVLEIGCGAGANIPFLLTTGAQYFAVEGSAAAAAKARDRFATLGAQIHTGDFIDDMPFSGEFDVIVDRAAMTHNDEASIRRGLAKLAAKLKPSGLYIGIDWFSTKHDGFRTGEATSDERTREHFTSGPFAGVGRVHFSDEAHLRDLFAGYEFLALEEKVTEVALPTRGVLASWNFVARKP